MEVKNAQTWMGGKSFGDVLKAEAIAIGVTIASPRRRTTTGRRQQRSSSKILIQYSVHAASWLSFLVRRQNSTERASERASPPSFLPYLRSAAVALPRSELGDNERCSSGGERMRLVKVGPVPIRYDGGTAPSKFRCVRGRKPTPTLGMMQDTRLESRSHG